MSIASRATKAHLSPPYQRVSQATHARREPPSPVSLRPFKPWHSRLKAPAAFASEKSAPQGSGSKDEPAPELVAVVKRGMHAHPFPFFRVLVLSILRLTCGHQCPGWMDPS